MPAARERSRFEGRGGCAQTPQSCCSASVYTLTTPSCESSHAHISSSELAGPSHDRSQSRSPANAHSVAYAPHLSAPKFVLSWILSKVQSETACCNKATRCRLWRSAERCEKQVQRLISPLHCYRMHRRASAAGPTNAIESLMSLGHWTWSDDPAVPAAGRRRSAVECKALSISTSQHALSPPQIAPPCTAERFLLVALSDKILLASAAVQRLRTWTHGAGDLRAFMQDSRTLQQTTAFPACIAAHA